MPLRRQTLKACRLVVLIIRLLLWRRLTCLLSLLLRWGRSLCLCRLLRLILRTTWSGTMRIENLLQLFAIERGVSRTGDAVFVGKNVALRTLRQLLFIGRQRQESCVLLLHQIGGSHHRDRPVPENTLRIHQKQNDRQVNDNGDPEGLAHPRSAKLVLHLNQ